MKLYTKILIGMGVGVLLGFVAGPNSCVLPATGVELSPDARVYSSPEVSTANPLAAGIPRMKIIEERVGDPRWLKVRWTLKAADLLRLKSQGVGAAGSIKAGAKLEGWVIEEMPQVRRFAPIGRTMVASTEWIGLLFLALIKMVVVPLVFFSLVVGVASLGDFKKLGRIGLRTILYFTGTTIFALTIGVTLTNIIRPGKLLAEDERATLLANYQAAAGDTVASAAETPGLVEQLIGMVPSNPIRALAEGEMLQIIVFALLLGVALTMLQGTRAKLVVDVFDRLNDAMVMLVHIAMKLAPYGVAALLFKVVGSTGLSVLLALAVYGVTVQIGLLIHLTAIYGSVVRFGVKLPFIGFLRAIRPALLLGFSTSSSSATLPVTIECNEKNMGVSSSVSSFVLPLGATVNMDGTALYQGVAAIFIAQIYGIDLDFVGQATVVISATLASIGTAGVPGAGMITLAMVLTAVGVPTEGLALILGLDRLLDMFRSATNIIGDSTATTLMARLEGEKLEFKQEELDQTPEEQSVIEA